MMQAAIDGESTQGGLSATCYRGMLESSERCDLQ